MIIGIAVFLGASYLFIMGCLYFVQFIEKIEKKVKASYGADTDRWVCPFCKGVFEKSPQMKALSRDPDATVMILASQNPRCPACHAELDGQKMLDGRYDLRRSRGGAKK